MLLPASVEDKNTIIYAFFINRRPPIAHFTVFIKYRVWDSLFPRRRRPLPLHVTAYHGRRCGSAGSRTKQFIFSAVFRTTRETTQTYRLGHVGQQFSQVHPTTGYPLDNEDYNSASSWCFRIVRVDGTPGSFPRPSAEQPFMADRPTRKKSAPPPPPSS